MASRKPFKLTTAEINAMSTSPNYQSLVERMAAFLSDNSELDEEAKRIRTAARLLPSPSFELSEKHFDLLISKLEETYGALEELQDVFESALELEDFELDQWAQEWFSGQNLPDTKGSGQGCGNDVYVAGTLSVVKHFVGGVRMALADNKSDMAARSVVGVRKTIDRLVQVVNDYDASLVRRGSEVMDAIPQRVVDKTRNLASELKLYVKETIQKLETGK